MNLRDASPHVLGLKFGHFLTDFHLYLQVNKLTTVMFHCNRYNFVQLLLKQHSVLAEQARLSLAVVVLYILQYLSFLIGKVQV